ncbi:unnamed protein product, partial [Prorocentrum cordatum]
MARRWELLRRPAVRARAKQQERDNGAAAGGTSRKREAMRRIFPDECNRALGIPQGCALADIERFYDCLRIDTLIPEALAMNISPRQIIALMRQRSSARAARKTPATFLALEGNDPAMVITGNEVMKRIELW